MGWITYTPTIWVREDGQYMIVHDKEMTQYVRYQASDFPIRGWRNAVRFESLEKAMG